MIELPTDILHCYDDFLERKAVALDRSSHHNRPVFVPDPLAPGTCIKFRAG